MVSFSARKLFFFLGLAAVVLSAAVLWESILPSSSAEAAEMPPTPTPELLVVEKTVHVPYTEYVPIPEPVRVVIPVEVERVEYVEVPCGVSSRTERYAGIEISAWEMELMARLAWREARGEKMLGMRLVLEVVLNRVLSPHFPNTVYGVLYDGDQFKPYGGALELEEITPTEAQYEAVAQVLSQTPMTDEDVVFFAQSPIYGDTWMQVGGHYFTYYPDEW